MKNKIRKLFFIFAFANIFIFPVFSMQLPELTGPVVDNARLLNQTEFSELDEFLRAVSDQTGTQIAVLTIPSLSGLPIETYSLAVAEKWKLGYDDKGVLLVVAYDEKKIRIEVGYGLEDKLTDVKAGLIIRNVIAPEFQNGQYGRGIISGVKNIAGICGVEGVTVNKSVLNPESAPDEKSVPTILIILFFYFVMLTGGFSTKFTWLRWLPWAFLFRNSGRSSSSSHSSFYSGSSHSGFSGSSSGGFHGGGGGFGGGGASGGW